MSRKTYVTPGNLTKTGAMMGAVVAAAFLVFGATFAYVVLQNASTDEAGLRLLMMMFFAIWILVCGGMVFYFARVASGMGTAADNALINLESGDSDDGADKKGGK